MARITVFGGTGYAGSHIVQNALSRGHQVTVVSRSATNTNANTDVGATVRAGDASDHAFVRELAADSDVIVAAISPRGDLATPGALRAIYRALAATAAETGTRLGVVGGAGSLQVSDGGPLLADTPDFPEAIRAEAHELAGVLADLRAHPSAGDWFFVSPAANFGAFAPGEALGTYRVGGDVLVTDAAGQSSISGPDFGLAVVDEIEQPAHRNTRFTVAY